MKFYKSEILFKIIWIVLILITIYTFSWLTFIFYTFGNIETENFTLWNQIVPNILTIGIIILYSKELLTGYKTESKRRNFTSLFLFTTLIIILSLLQHSQFEFILEQSKSEYYQTILCLIVILSSYVGIILNRIIKFKELK